MLSTRLVFTACVCAWCLVLTVNRHSLLITHHSLLFTFYSLLFSVSGPVQKHSPTLDGSAFLFAAESDGPRAARRVEAPKTRLSVPPAVAGGSANHGAQRVESKRQRREIESCIPDLRKGRAT